jgi:FkbM family methyltransferase
LIKRRLRSTWLFPRLKSVQRHLDRQHARAQQARRDFYKQFVPQGGLVFDVGANMGDRSKTFLALGAHVIAVEPQQICVNVLAQCFGRNPRFTLIPTGVAAASGVLPLRLASSHVLASMSPEYVARTEYADNEWLEEVVVHVTTLDALIDVFGLPDFCKIDVEGFEPQVLKGLSAPLPALSFEFNPELRNNALACLARLALLGDCEFAFAAGESTATLEWLGLDDARQVVETGNEWGDFYARYLPPRETARSS